MIGYAYYEYLNMDGDRLFTMVALPSESGKFPTVVCRTPYVKSTVEQPEQELTDSFLRSHQTYLERGYAVVFQHCKGCGKSSGAFVPYIHEREDGLFLREWIRSQAFYNGELFLVGSSYTSSLHYATAPFEQDIRAAVFEVQDSERYRLWYRNGQMRKGHANWHFGLYKSKLLSEKRFTMQSFADLPLAGLSQRAFGEPTQDFEQMLEAPHPTDSFWSTRNGGADARDALTHANIPILLTTGYNDYYIGGVFRMWNEMDEATKRQSALLVSPYNHGDGYDAQNSTGFPMGKRSEQFGSYRTDWFDHVRKGTPLSHEKGVITYYRVFENRWESDFYKAPTNPLRICLGEGTRSFVYDPLAPTAFVPEGCFATESNPESAMIRVYTPPIDRDLFIKGQMRAVLSVSSNCADTSFYLRIAVCKPEYTYALRHDITSLSYQHGECCENAELTLDFCFDEHAFLLKKGERLQIDIASTDDHTYVSHTNRAGAYHLQKSAKTATNTVHLDRSYLILPVETK